MHFFYSFVPPLFYGGILGIYDLKSLVLYIGRYTSKLFLFSILKP